MANASDPGLNLFIDILIKLEELEIPYAIIGGFAATMYGITRATFDIDIIVDLKPTHIQALCNAFPLPRYYADPEQMRRATELGSSFNIIDATLGEKADLFPLSMDARYEPAFTHRIRQIIDLPGRNAFAVWAARPEDVIVGKLMAWQEGRSDRHPADIFEMLLFHYLDVDPQQVFDGAYVLARAKEIGAEAADLWSLLFETAQEERDRK
ncbi:MAG: nucleotidyl transferase AbiEii/AbiGii toxin family protein [Anaerolineales bacterium]|nr:nucleotidyl transferase AbiEii/AbiGii toxin family protein [Anaerolineales bacterium]